MKREMRKYLTTVLMFGAAALISSGGLAAETTHLFVHGLSTEKHCKSMYGDDSKTQRGEYWGAGFTSSQTIKYVGFDPNVSGGAFAWGTCGAQKQLFDAIYTSCVKSRGQKCKIYSHSTGGLVIAKMMQFLESARMEQFFDIQYVRLMANASGGSELADSMSVLRTIPEVRLIGYFVAMLDHSEVRNSVAVGPARSNFDHNRTFGLTMHLASGTGDAYARATKPILPGHDDSVVATHSLCGAITNASLAHCPMGTGSVSRQNTWWNPFGWGTSNDPVSRWSNHKTVYHNSDKNHSDSRFIL